MTEIDVAFWVPVAKVDPTGASKRPHNLTWFLPYVFVDNPLALATGARSTAIRRIWGPSRSPRAWRMPTSSA